MDKREITEEERCLGEIATALEAIEDDLEAAFRGFDRVWRDRNIEKAIRLREELVEVSKHAMIACAYRRELEVICKTAERVNMSKIIEI